MPLFVHGQEVVSIRNLAATAGTESRLLRAHRRHGLSQSERERGSGRGKLMLTNYFKRNLMQYIMQITMTFNLFKYIY